jgi:hypothetical protein
MSSLEDKEYFWENEVSDCTTKYSQKTIQRRRALKEKTGSYLTEKEKYDLENQGWVIRYIYEITNLINGKTYYGQRTLKKGQATSTVTDNYMGSGKLLHQAFLKYGKENFQKKVIIEGSFSKDQINKFECCIIRTMKLCNKAEYNLATGGDGGNLSQFIDYKQVSQSVSTTLKRLISTTDYKPFGGKQPGKTKGSTGYHWTILNHQQGEKNSQYGTHWYTNGILNVRSKNCPEGFKLGRTCIRTCVYVCTVCGKEISKGNKSKLCKTHMYHKDAVFHQRWSIIQESNIDFTKFGWVSKLAKLFGISTQMTSIYVKLEYPDFYATCFKRK